MKTLTPLAAGLLLVALAPLAAADKGPSCTWNPYWVQDQSFTVGPADITVLFLNGVPLCQVEIRCTVDGFVCPSFPIPP